MRSSAFSQKARKQDHFEIILVLRCHMIFIGHQRGSENASHVLIVAHRSYHNITNKIIMRAFAK